MNANRDSSLSGADPAERIEGPRRTLVLGGVRSGKSRFAESLARASGLPVTYSATARALDEEMRERIAPHRNRRPADWRLVEEPVALAETLARECSGDRCCLVECLTLWLTNQMVANIAAGGAAMSVLVRSRGGFTGDTAGALVELVDTLIVLVLALVFGGAAYRESRAQRAPHLPRPRGEGRGNGMVMAAATYILRGGADAMAVRPTTPRRRAYQNMDRPRGLSTDPIASANTAAARVRRSALRRWLPSRAAGQSGSPRNRSLTSIPPR
jgi:hypothetical protein